jgi:DNA repair exonuclease SbcCD ATPase subunit
MLEERIAELEAELEDMTSSAVHHLEMREKFEAERDEWRKRAEIPDSEQQRIDDLESDVESITEERDKAKAACKKTQARIERINDYLEDAGVFPRGENAEERVLALRDWRDELAKEVERLARWGDSIDAANVAGGVCFDLGVGADHRVNGRSLMDAVRARVAPLLTKLAEQEALLRDIASLPAIPLPVQARLAKALDAISRGKGPDE